MQISLKAMFWVFLGVLPAFSGHIVVNLTQQRACAYRGNQPVFCGNISSGKPDHRTPIGRFRILEKDIDHVSNKYPEPDGGARMHYMLRLTRGGIAMHLGPTPNYPASHGCIRMQNGFAQRMYRWSDVGMPVRVIGRPPRRVNRSSFSNKSVLLDSDGIDWSNVRDVLSAFMGRTKHRTTSRRPMLADIRDTRRKRRPRPRTNPLSIFSSH
jgi:hypothetical protein